MKERICKHCGKTYKPKAADRITFCSRKCYQLSKKDGTGRLELVKDYASYILNKHGRIRSNIKIKSDLHSCINCGSLIKKRKRYCEECNSVQWVQYYAKKHADIWTKERTCKICGRLFVKPYGSKSYLFCSSECQERNKKDSAYHTKIRRDSRLKNQHIERVYRKKVFERDNWRCQICGKKVKADASCPHPKAPTIDHIIPISEGGEHSYRNVRTAHFICNSLRGSNATQYGDQTMLFG